MIFPVMYYQKRAREIFVFLHVILLAKLHYVKCLSASILRGRKKEKSEVGKPLESIE